ncbi:uncharacterized conserved protein [Candidatus Scalindua japonica]|uniref:Uncharacterized conserved protein n=1 Tax=Candidatus Scalindua japonica TaxID=1284222 RepID=A0A286TXV3_9BACT|nr:DUF58 domain-containing protein [Candidatus Scalindua japonica]GAX60713.1 uncharacterized conserved protein [Candidatus Scalindua japonica]
MLGNIFDAKFLKKLDSLCIECKKTYGGVRKGNYEAANKKGTSIEFADYQEYMPGDDFRYIDWNIYGRLDKLLIKTFKEEEELSVHVLFDVSRSMLYPEEDKKFDYAKDLVIALSYIALSSKNSVRLATMVNTDKISKDRTPFFQQKENIFVIADFLKKVIPRGELDFVDYISKYIYDVKGRRGTVVVISDFMMKPEVYTRALNYLRFKNFDIKVIQILGETELDPFGKGNKNQVIDVETNKKMNINFSEANRKKYKAAMEDHIQQLKRFCSINRIIYSLAKTNIKFEDFILRELPRIGFIR